MPLLLVALIVVPLVGLGVYTSQRTEDHIDMIELNHCYNKHGDFVFDQVIFWRWNVEHNRHEVGAWTMHSDAITISHRDGLTAVDYWDACCQSRRNIRTTDFKETWTQHDPEVENKRIHPERERVGLSKLIAERIKAEQ